MGCNNFDGCIFFFGWCDWYECGLREEDVCVCAKIDSTDTMDLLLRLYFFEQMARDVVVK